MTTADARRIVDLADTCPQRRSRLVETGKSAHPTAPCNSVLLGGLLAFRAGRSRDHPRQALAEDRRAPVLLDVLNHQLDAPRMISLLRKYPPGHPCLHQVVMNGTDRTLWVAQAVDDRTTDTPGAQNQEFYPYDLRALLADVSSR